MVYGHCYMLCIYVYGIALMYSTMYIICKGKYSLYSILLNLWGINTCIKTILKWYNDVGLTQDHVKRLYQKRILQKHLEQG